MHLNADSDIQLPSVPAGIESYYLWLLVRMKNIKLYSLAMLHPWLESHHLWLKDKMHNVQLPTIYPHIESNYLYLLDKIKHVQLPTVYPHVEPYYLWLLRKIKDVQLPTFHPRLESYYLSLLVMMRDVQRHLVQSNVKWYYLRLLGVLASSRRYMVQPDMQWYYLWLVTVTRNLQRRRRVVSLSAAAGLILVLLYLSDHRSADRVADLAIDYAPPRITRWTHHNWTYSVDSEPLHPLPNKPRRPKKIPRIQLRSWSYRESRKQQAVRLQRLEAVRSAFVHAYSGYVTNAWLHDEVAPLAGGYKDNFGGWGATLVDSLDTLWIMDLKDNFTTAVNAIKDIKFASPEGSVSTFETTIRFLGGLLGAYDVSGCKYHVLLSKAIELGDFLYMSFDTPNHMPISHFDWQEYLREPQQQSTKSILADLASLTVEFTRLSQLTGDNKYFDAVQRVTDVLDQHQNETQLPGLWPTDVNLADLRFSDFSEFTLGANADSTFEYLPKQYLLLGGRSDQSLRMYKTALAAIKKHLLFKHMNPANKPLVMSGTVNVNDKGSKLDMRVQHLTCFVGGMVGLGAKIVGSNEDLVLARQLTDACVWAYQSMPTGIMPDSYRAHGCSMTNDDCTWSDTAWYTALQGVRLIGQTLNGEGLEEDAKRYINSTGIVPGMMSVDNAAYYLRPEAVESVFLLYRMTGDKTLQDNAWDLFTAIDTQCRTEIAHAEIVDVRRNHSGKADKMQSFWLAETLKYLYLIFDDPEHVSLDHFVFNTEAHPLKRPI